jgi:hypothetical protein
VTSEVAKEEIVIGYVEEGKLPDVPVYVIRSRGWAEQHFKRPRAVRVTVKIELLEDE